MCDPLKPRKIQFSDISAAAFNIRKAVLMTPCTVRYLILSISRLFKVRKENCVIYIYI